MRRDAKGREILKEGPAVSMDTIDFDRLRAESPPDSLGSAYVSFMDSHEFNPDERKSVMYVDDEELAYVMQRYREMHDFWHVILDIETSVRGEIAVKWFELLQTGLPMNALSAMVGPLGLDSATAAKVWQIDMPWAVEAASKAEFFMNVKFEDHMDEDLDSIRSRLRIVRHPGCC